MRTLIDQLYSTLLHNGFEDLPRGVSWFIIGHWTWPTYIRFGRPSNSEVLHPLQTSLVCLVPPPVRRYQYNGCYTKIGGIAVQLKSFEIFLGTTTVCCDWVKIDDTLHWWSISGRSKEDISSNIDNRTILSYFLPSHLNSPCSLSSSGYGGVSTRTTRGSRAQITDLTFFVAPPRLCFTFRFSFCATALMN